MLSRTADNLYWIARYIERAETMARLLEVGSRIALLPSSGTGYRSEWDSLLQASGTAIGFGHKYGDPVQRNIESYLFFDRDNPSSVASCLFRARENARIVRTALTTQVWDAINTAFQELRDLERRPRSELELSQLTEWTMRHAAMLRGAIDATLLRNDGWDFLNLGYCLERAANTARLMEDNPILQRLKELEALEKLVEKVGRIDLHTGVGVSGFDALLSGLLKPGRDAETDAK